jgi:hypothetical protein
VQPAEVTANIRELIVQLTRGNCSKAESIVDDLSLFLNGVLKSKDDPESPQMLRAQQTFFAIDETRLMLAQRDFRAATAAARDAAKEWK